MKKGMELVMIKLEVCYACELFEPVAKQISEDRNVVYKPNHIPSFLIVQ